MIWWFSRRRKAERYLERLGCDALPHLKDQSLLEHLKRVADWLDQQGSDEKTILAGLCHSLYGTEFYTRAPLPHSDRSLLRRLIGDFSEEIVWQFGRAKSATFLATNDTLTFTDRVTTEPTTLRESSAHSFAEVVVANGYDHLNQNHQNNRQILSMISPVLQLCNTKIKRLISSHPDWP